jgi:riboflavin biosynthesis pyrimidine reductase
VPSPIEQREDDPPQALRLQGLLPASAPVTVAEVLDGLGLWQQESEPTVRPKVLLNMVSTADGRATLDGRSGALGSSADHALFHGLRSAVDAVLVGAGTVRVERYGRLIKDERQRQLRLERGLEEEPLACIVSGRMALDEDVPLLQESTARVLMITSSAASLPPCPATVEYVRTLGGRLDLHAAMAELSDRFAIGTLLCEGGPHLARELLAEGLVDELFLSLSPLLAGGEPVGGEALRILAGAALEPPAGLELVSVLRYESCLFLRYRVSARARVSRETTDSSSLAS